MSNNTLNTYKVQIVYPAVHEYIIEANNMKTAIAKAFEKDKESPAKATIDYQEEPYCKIIPIQK